MTTERDACDALHEAGLDLAPAQVRVEAREDRWLVLLPAERLAWFPVNPRGHQRLQTERRILRLLAQHCSFAAPRILFESDAGWDVRAAVPGICDPWALYEQTQTDRPLAQRIGRAIGRILVEQHTRISHDDVMGWLSERPAWPEPSDQIRQRLPSVIHDTSLLAQIDRVLDEHDRAVAAREDRVLVHGDLGLHNIAVDPHTSEVLGVFDYEGASWADRHCDFRYLLFDIEREDALEAALEVYEPAVDRILDRRRIRLYNVGCAIGFLALRQGIPPEQRSCGRTLAQDLSWLNGALARL